VSTETDSRVVALVSGGVESAVMLHVLAEEGREVHPVYARQGFRWERAEHRALTRFLAAADRPELRPLTVLVVPLADLYPDDHFGLGGAVPPAGTPDEWCYLPGRNLTMLTKAAVLAAGRGCPDLALGSLSSNPFPDATPAFFASLGRVLSEGLGHPVRILAPLAPLSKPEVLLRGKDLPLELSFSCMAPAGEIHCGVCSKCFERRTAFREAGLLDRTEYAGSPGPEG
jgi:7-cyano-7-deazaguanine synthase